MRKFPCGILKTFLRFTVEWICGALLAVVGVLSLMDNVGRFFNLVDCVWQVAVLSVGAFLLWDVWSLRQDRPD